MFREPAITAASIPKEVEQEDYLKGIRLSYRQALDVWARMYAHILYKHRHRGKWLFLHYNQVLTQDGLDKIEALTGAAVNRAFPDAQPHGQKRMRARFPGPSTGCTGSCAR
ncbi:MAG: hypothetical protein HND48_21365 [Chloroflexi bacterium]|nr:hypothetical protein [Chloroflexota bacterium]